MTHIHYKFSSKLSYDTVVFDGPHITLKDLKRQIMGREKLRAGDCDLQITDAQTKEEYTDEEGLIHKGSSVIVRRIPLIGGKSGSHSKNRNAERSDVHLHHALGAVKAMDDQNSTRAIPLFSKMANLADVEGTEEDKIQVMINQSSYDTMNHNKKFSAALPSNYTCYRCGMAGHHIRHCPTIGQDKNAEAPVRIRKSTGIPRSFMVEVDDPSIKGAMLTNFGRYAVPAIDAEAYAIGKKERPPFFPQEQPKSEDEEDPVPGELVCLICHDLLTDAVVIPCCGNSYCDDCIRSTLLDSEQHVCPTCDQCDVSPDTLIANRFLRQAVNTFKKEQGHIKSLKGKGGSSESQNATPTLSPVPTPPPPTLQIQMMPKPYQPSHSQQDPLRSNAADSPQSSQVCVASPIATDPASAYETAGTSPQTVQSQLETPNKEPEEKTHENMHYDSADASPTVEVSHKDLAAAPSPLIPLVTQAPAAEQPQAVVADLQQSASATGPTARRSRPSTCWDSSSSTPGGPTGVWNESHTQRPPSSSSSSSPYPATPPPLFPSPHFHTFLTQQPPCGYPPGYHPSPSPVWALPTPRGAPIPSLCSVTSTATIPTLIPKEWYRPHKKKERSPHRGSTYRRSSSGSYSKTLKSKSSRPYSPSSSRSRSPSRSQGRSRPNSHYRDPHPRSHSSHSYSYGFKRSRSPTPSSSSSPKVGYHSRSKSPADHCNKKSYHGRHHNRKSTSSGYSSRRRGESSQSEAGGSGGSMAGYLYHPHASQSSSLELDRERYLQWKHEYKEWCEKYFSSYVGHFHQMPPPLLSYPPPLLPPHWDRGGSRNPSHHAKSESRNRNQARRPALMDVRSPQSQSSSDSRSPLSQSSSDSCSTASQSFSDTRSSPSHSSQDSRSLPSHSSSDGRSTPSQDAAQPGTSYGGLPNTLAKGSEGEEGELQEKSKDDKLKLIGANSEKRTTFKHKQNMKKHEEGSRNKSSVPIAVEPNYDVEKEKKRGYAGPNDSVNGSPVPEEGSDPEALESLQPLEKPDKRLDEDRERNSREQRNWEMERGRRRGKHSDSRQDGERRHREKPCKEAGRLDTDRHRKPGAGSKASDSRSDQKRRADDAERSAVGKAQSSKCPKAKMAEDPHINKMESPDPIDRKKQKTEKKRERKTLHLNREMDIWEGGMKVKPQAKISININLDGKGKDEKLEKQDLCYSESLTGKTMEVFEKTTEMRVNEKKESSTDQDVVLKAIKPDEGEARPLWEKATFRDDQGEVRENVAGDKKDIGENSPEEGELEDFDSWQCEEKESGRRRRRQQEKKGGMEASSVVGVTNNEKRSVRGGQAEKGRGRNDSRGRELVPGVTILPKERTAGENTCKEDGVRVPGKSKPNEELMEGARWRLREEEEEEDDSRNQNHHYRANTPLEDSSYEDHRERKTVVQTLDENSQDNTTNQEDQLVLIQVPRSKWEKDESEEEEEDEGEIKVSMVADTAAHRETDEENEQNSQKSVELERDENRAIETGMVREETYSILSGSHRSVAPSSGKGVPGSTLCPNKDTERRMEPDGPRDRERGKESERRRERQKESRRSEDGRREEKKGRTGEKERGQKRNLPPSSHHYSNSTSHDTERRDRQRGETGRDHSHYYFNQQVPSENHRHHSPTTSIPHGQGKERELTPDRSRRESKAKRRERKQNKADRGMKVDQEMAAKRRGGVGRCEDEADGQAELEEGEKSSSNSVGSSAGQQSSRDDRRKERKKSNKEKREAVLELPQEGQLKKHKKSTEGRRDRGEKEEEEDCSKLCSIMSS